MLRGNHEERAINSNISCYQGGSFLYQCAEAFSHGEQVEPALLRTVEGLIGVFSWLLSVKTFLFQR